MSIETGPCTPWATQEDVRSPCDDYSVDAGDMEDALQAASEIVYALSGRQHPGICERIEERPCADDCGCGTAAQRLTVGLTGQARCGLSDRKSVKLVGYPVREITEVLLDGEIVDPAEYRLDHRRDLVRLKDADGRRLGWPCCQDMGVDVDQLHTFAVSYTYGKAIPRSGVKAVAQMACEIYRMEHPEEFSSCNFPQRVQQLVRQGVTITMMDPQDFLDEGRTGLYFVDLFLRTFNPKKLARRASVMTPETFHRRSRWQ